MVSAFLLGDPAEAQSIEVLRVGVDPYETVVDILAERRENGELMSLEMTTLGKGACEGLAANVTATGVKLDVSDFVKECDGVGVTLLQQMEQPELPMFIDTAIVTYVNYGNIPYAKKHPELFFGNGQFYFPGIVSNAKRRVCEDPETLKTLQDAKAEMATRYMVGELFAYDVRVTYKTMGIVSVRYFLDQNSEPFYPDRHDYNFTCDE